MRAAPLLLAFTLAAAALAFAAPSAGATDGCTTGLSCVCTGLDDNHCNWLLCYGPKADQYGNADRCIVGIPVPCQYCKPLD